jgi:germination protein YpeB
MENDVVMYPDLIKVSVSLENGEVLSFDATGYISNHNERNNTTPQIPLNEAKESINNQLEVIDTRVCVVPTEWKTEILCWEFKGKVDDTDFLVYINTETGREEDILIIVNTNWFVIIIRLF